MQHEWDKIENYQDLEPEAKAFVDWLVLPNELRDTETQAQLADDLGVGERTLSDWQKRQQFIEIKNKRYRDVRALQDLETIMDATKNRAVNREGKEANEATEIWLKWFYNEDMSGGPTFNINQSQAQSSENQEQTETVDLSEQLEDDPELRNAYRRIRKAQQKANDKQ